MYGENLVAGTEGDTGDFGREYVRLPSGISMQATATERLYLSPQGEFPARMAVNQRMEIRRKRDLTPARNAGIGLGNGNSRVAARK